MKLRIFLSVLAALALACPAYADTKISQFPSGGALQSGDLIPVVRGGVNYGATYSGTTAGVSTFNTRSGAVTLTAPDVGSVLLTSAVPHYFVTGLTSSGVFTVAQPAFTDISGTVAASQLPTPTTSTLGGIVALATSTAHQVVQYVNTSGQQVLAQLGFADISGTISAAQLGGSYTNGQLLIGSTSTGQLAPATLTAGSNVTITNGPGTITIASTASGGSMVYPGAGIPLSTGSAWGTSYSTSGTGNVALTTSPIFTTPNIGTATGNITGNAATVTTNANLTGPITSSGNATSVASQTGTGSTFAMSASPTFTGTVTLPAGQAVNGVTLTTGGSSTAYLNGAGAYTTLAGGGTVNSGLTGNAAYYAANGTAVSGSTYIAIGTNSIAIPSFSTAGVITNNSSGVFSSTPTVATSGDISIGTTGIVTVTGIEGTAVSTPTGTGAVVLQASPTITGGITLGTNLTFSAATPTVSSGFGTSPSVTAGTATSFRLNVGTGGSATTGVVGLPTATNGWNCFAQDVTTPASFITAQTASTVSTASLANYSRTTGSATAWTASDILAINCVAY